MGQSIRIKRGTRAQIDAAKTAGQLAAGEPYLVTDENRIAMGTATDAYAECVMDADIGVSVCSQTDARLYNRERLTADREYYVRTDGNDSNDGLADSASRAFATIQKAVDVVCGSIDSAAYQVYINIVDDGTHTADHVRFYSIVGAKTPILRGSGSGMSIVSYDLGGHGRTFIFEYGSKWIIEKCKFIGDYCIACIYAPYGGTYVGVRDVEFGAISSTGSHMFAINGSLIEILGSYAITGSARFHWNSSSSSIIFSATLGITITLVDTPAFDFAFCKAQTALIRTYGITFSGAATGPRYLVQTMGTINTNNAGESFFPGDVVGVAQTGGMYL